MAHRIAIHPHEHLHEHQALAFAFSLAAGIWMLATGGLFGGLGSHAMMGGMAGSGYGQAQPFQMYGWGGMNGWMWGRGFTFGAYWPWFGVVAGTLVTLGALFLYLKPELRRVWGGVIVVASVLSFFLGMGAFIASVLGVIGGVLALAA